MVIAYTKKLINSPKPIIKATLRLNKIIVLIKIRHTPAWALRGMNLAVCFIWFWQFLFWLVSKSVSARFTNFGFCQTLFYYAPTVTRSAIVGSVIFVTIRPLAIFINDKLVPGTTKRSRSGFTSRCASTGR